MNYQTVMSPLQLNAAPGLYQGGAVGINAQFVTQLTTFQSSNLMAPLMSAVASAVGNVSLGVSNATVDAMRSMGASTHPVLGNTIPQEIFDESPVVGDRPEFLTIELRQVGEFYLEDLNKFAQAFAAIDGYIQTTNPVIVSAVNANQYLGPTFTNMDDLITSELSSINLALEEFGQDLADLGQAFDPSEPETIGIPSSILNQITRLAGGLTPAIQDALVVNGVDLGQPISDQTEKDIFQALTQITGDDLQQALSILEVNSPGIETLADLLNPVLTFPRSFASLTVPTPAGAALIFNTDGTVNLVLDTVSVPAGCEQLAKIMPPSQARANQALQVAFGQLSSVGELTLPDLAGILL